jgi:hypothetical protein
MRLKVVLCTLGVLLLVAPAVADEIQVGTLNFEIEFAPDQEGESPGTNVFFALNLTGSPDFGGPLTFTDAYLTLFEDGGGSSVYGPETIGSGGSFQTGPFSAETLFLSATFTGVVQEHGWTLSGTLLPSSGSYLAAGDWAFVYANRPEINPDDTPNGDPIQAPEPSSLVLLATGIGTLAMRRRRVSK